MEQECRAAALTLSKAHARLAYLACAEAVLSTAAWSCPVCLSPAEPGLLQALTPCAHSFCAECLRTPLAVHPQCPVCRERVTAQEARCFSKAGAEALGEFAEFGSKLQAVVRRLQQIRAEDGARP